MTLNDAIRVIAFTKLADKADSNDCVVDCRLLNMIGDDLP